MTRRLAGLGGCLLLGQAAVEGVLAFWADILITGIGPEDDPLSLAEEVSRGEEVGAATAVLMVLALLSLVSAVQTFRHRSAERLMAAVAHVGGGVAVFLHDAPVLGALLVVAGAVWAATCLRAQASRPSPALASSLR